MKKIFILAAMLLTLHLCGATNEADSLNRGIAGVYYETGTLTHDIWAKSSINSDTTAITFQYACEPGSEPATFTLPIESYQAGEFGITCRLSGNSTYSYTLFEYGVPMECVIIRMDMSPVRKLILIF